MANSSISDLEICFDHGNTYCILINPGSQYEHMQPVVKCN